MPASQQFDAHKSRHERREKVDAASPRKTIVTRPEDPSDNRIYVQPAWAVQTPIKKRPLRDLWRRVTESRLVEAARFEVKILLLVAVMAFMVFMAFVGLKGFYRTKSAAGVDLTPIHAPNLVPFIR